MEESGREKDAAGPPWAPSNSTAFRQLPATVSAWAEAPPAQGNGVAVGSSNLRAVRKRPLVARLTRDIIQTFENCNPEFSYSDSLNPKRFLTSPAVPVHNNGLDNANSDLILYVNMELVNEKSYRRYIVEEILGQGTFGQVAKCRDVETDNYVAVKVIKNQPAFYQQSLTEVSLLSTLNRTFDPHDEHHIVRMLDFFACKNHLCISFEMLGQNLYELLRQNGLRGLQMKLVRSFSKQILDALIVTKGAGIIHCDLKPENILVTQNAKTDTEVKVIDFGSACMEGKTIYSYIQSRYYRSPEVILGYPYTTAIDMWSFGCIVAEMYIGIPLFLGASEYDVLRRMIEIVGVQPPDDLLREAKNTKKFFKHVGSIYPGNEGHDSIGSPYRMLTEEEVEARESQKPKVGRWYFPRRRLDSLISGYPWKNLEEGNLPETEKADCLALVDFLRGLIEFDPNKRWSPLQASYHPFITGEVFTGPYDPIQETPIIQSTFRFLRSTGRRHLILDHRPVGRAAAVDHNPGGGHWFAAGLSPQVGSFNRSLPFNNALLPNMPFSYGSSCGSFGSHGSFNENVGPASSYGSYDVNNVNMYHSPLGPGFNLQSQAGGSFVGFSPDIRRRSHLSHSGGIRLSPGGPGPMSLGASPSQYTPPNSQMQIPTSDTAKYVATSPARGSHGSSLGKSAAVGQFNRRRNLGHPPVSTPPHEHTYQPIQGHHGDGVSSAFSRGHSGYSHGALPNSGHYNWRPQIGIPTGLSANPSSNHGYFQPSGYNDFPPLHKSSVSADTLASTSSIPDPADWDPNYSDESLLQEENSLAAELRGLHLRDASGQTIQSSRLPNIQSHDTASSNPLSINQRSDRLFHAPSLGENNLSADRITYHSYNHANYSQQNFPGRHVLPFQRYNHMNSTYMRPIRSLQNGQSVWPNYSVAEPTPSSMDEGPWGGRGGHSFATGGLPPPFGRKDFGRIY